MMSSPLISVIIPVYNTREYLRDCLESIFRQSYSNLQIIAIDDGSTDGCALLLDQLGEEDRRLKVVHKENEGVSATRNIGIELAIGDYITFVDSDDLLEKEMYEILIHTIVETKAQIAHCSYSRMNELDVKQIGGSKKLIVQSSEKALGYLIDGTMFGGSLCNKLFRSDLFTGIRLREDINFNEDLLCVYQLFQKADIIAFVDQCKYIYRVSETSACANTSSVMKARDCVSVAEEMYRLALTSDIKRKTGIKTANTLIYEYRSLILSGSREFIDMEEIKKRLTDLKNEGISINVKKKIEYLLMSYIPNLYRMLYSAYNKIRVPNWDVVR